MAIMGMSFVDAINEVVETVLEFPMTAGSSGEGKPSENGDTTSIYYRAEQFIDRENTRIQAWGWPENTRKSKKFTAGGSSKEIVFAAAGDVLKVRGSGPDGHRTLVMRKANGNTQLYDADLGSIDITSANGGDVYLDVVEKLDFSYLPTHVQDVIVARAKWTFQRRMQGNMQLDQALMQEYMQAESIAVRNKPDAEEAFNVRPSLGPAPQAPPQQG
jgi:hypothetical protein